MELEIFDSSRLTMGRISKPAIHIQKSGLFTLNKKAVETMCLTEASTLSLVHDKSNPRDWYLMRDPNGVVLRKAAGNMKFNAKPGRDRIIESLNIKDPNRMLRFYLATDPTQHEDKMLWAILTSKLI